MRSLVSSARLADVTLLSVSSSISVIVCPSSEPLIKSRLSNHLIRCGRSLAVTLDGGTGLGRSSDEEAAFTGVLERLGGLGGFGGSLDEEVAFAGVLVRFGDDGLGGVFITGSLDFDGSLLEGAEGAGALLGFGFGFDVGLIITISLVVFFEGLGISVGGSPFGFGGDEIALGFDVGLILTISLAVFFVGLGTSAEAARFCDVSIGGGFGGLIIAGAAFLERLLDVGFFGDLIVSITIGATADLIAVVAGSAGSALGAAVLGGGTVLARRGVLLLGTLMRMGAGGLSGGGLKLLTSANKSSSRLPTLIFLTTKGFSKCFLTPVIDDALPTAKAGAAPGGGGGGGPPLL